MGEDNYSLSSRVFHTIRENILSGKYATDEELKESLTFYASPEGVQSGHFGSALAAAGELAWRRGNYDQAIGLLEKALMVTQSRFGESDACAVIRQNLEMIKKEKEEKGITGAADKGGNPSHCASCQFKDAKF